MFSKEFFPARLKSLRCTKNMTQPQLADELGTFKQTINGWESGYRLPPLESIWKLADYFDVSIDYLVGRSEEPGRH